MLQGEKYHSPYRSQKTIRKKIFTNILRISFVPSPQIQFTVVPFAIYNLQLRNNCKLLIVNCQLLAVVIAKYIISPTPVSIASSSMSNVGVCCFEAMPLSMLDVPKRYMQAFV